MRLTSSQNTSPSLRRHAKFNENLQQLIADLLGHFVVSVDQAGVPLGQGDRSGILRLDFGLLQRLLQRVQDHAASVRRIPYATNVSANGVKMWPSLHVVFTVSTTSP
jgi:hypothetical protein